VVEIVGISAAFASANAATETVTCQLPVAYLVTVDRHWRSAPGALSGTAASGKCAPQEPAGVVG
jgi:hypothetical protein